MGASMKYWLSFLFVFLATSALAEDKKQIIVGYVEKIAIPSVDLTLKAKLDTGATTSSINATVIELPEKTHRRNEEGEKVANYVVFAIDSDDAQTKNLKKPITRFVKIKKKDGGFDRRAVVEMTFCIAGQLITEEVNLADRDHYNYDVLIGRNMLEEGRLIIDASRDHTAMPNCRMPDPDPA